MSDRIHNMLHALELAWRRYPDVTLATLMTCASTYADGDPHYASDADVLAGLEDIHARAVADERFVRSLGTSKAKPAPKRERREPALV